MTVITSRAPVRTSGRVHGGKRRAFGSIVMLLGLVITAIGTTTWHPLGLSALGAPQGSTIPPDLMAQAPAESFRWAAFYPYGALGLALVAAVVGFAIVAFRSNARDTATTTVLVPIGFGIGYGIYAMFTVVQAYRQMNSSLHQAPTMTQTVNGIHLSGAPLTPYANALLRYAVEPGAAQAVGAVLTALGGIFALGAMLILFKGVQRRRYL